MKVFNIASVFGLGFLVAAFGCSRPTEFPKDQASLEGVVYPHSKELKDNHGSLWQAKGHICNSCHGESAKNEAARNACTQCHGNLFSIFPHSNTFAKPAEHAAKFRGLDESGRAQCTKCHMSGKANAVSPSCYACHNYFPHPEDFFEPSNHAAKFARADEAGKNECRKCHMGDPLTQKAPTCTSCHSGLPHAADFSKPANHGAAFTAATDAARKECGKCHLTGSSTQIAPSCYACHKFFPHDKSLFDIEDPSDGAHAGPARSKDGHCAGCHGPNLDKHFKNISGCVECHDLGEIKKILGTEKKADEKPEAKNDKGAKLDPSRGNRAVSGKKGTKPKLKPKAKPKEESAAH